MKEEIRNEQFIKWFIVRYIFIDIRSLWMQI